MLADAPDIRQYFAVGGLQIDSSGEELVSEKQLPLSAIRFELHEAEDKVPRTGPLRRIGEFFDSKVGTALLTFIFTVMLGDLLTNGVSRIDKERDQRVADRAEVIHRRAELRASMADGLIDRATRASLVASAISNRLPKEDLTRRWVSYEQAYEAYNKMTFLIRADTDKLRPPAGEIGYGADRKVMRRRNAFIATLNGPITSSFARIDQCLVRAYSDSTNGRPGASPGSTLSCASSTGGKPWSATAEADKLRGCLATYLIQLDDLIDLRNKAEDPERALGPVGRWLDRRQMDARKLCAPHDFTCWEREVWTAAPDELKSDCATLGGKY